MQNLHTRKGTFNADNYIRLLMISSLYIYIYICLVVQNGTLVIPA